MDLSKSISIIIPTHNRSKYLERCLHYYKQNLSSIPLYICDSSKEKNLSEILLGLNYEHCPQKSFVEKVNDTLQKVQTPFVMLCADDDFFTLGGIKSAVEFLQKNAEYSTAHGIYTRFMKIKNEWVLFPLYENGLKNELESDDKLNRLQHLMQSYHPLFYAIQRIEVMQATYDSFIKNGISNLNFVEFLMAIIPISFGKIKMLPQYYCAREHIATSAGATALSFADIMRSEKMNAEYDAFLKVVHQFVFAKEDIFSKEKTEKLFVAYLKKGYTSPKKKLNKIIRQFLPKAMEQKIITQQQEKEIFSKIAQYQLHQGFPFANAIAKQEWENMQTYISKFPV